VVHRRQQQDDGLALGLSAREDLPEKSRNVKLFLSVRDLFLKFK
jgi:hypothetical protein